MAQRVGPWFAGRAVEGSGTGRTRDGCLLTTGGPISVRRRAPRNKRSQLDDVAVRIFDIRERYPWGMLASPNQFAAAGFPTILLPA